MAISKKNKVTNKNKVIRKEKRRIKKIDRRVDKFIKKGGDKRSLEMMRSFAKRTPGSKVATKGQTRRALRNGKLDLVMSDTTIPTSTKTVKKEVKPVKKVVKPVKKVVKPVKKVVKKKVKKSRVKRPKKLT